MVVTGELDTTCTPALGLEMARVLGTHQVLLPGTGTYRCSSTRTGWRPC